MGKSEKLNLQRLQALKIAGIAYQAYGETTEFKNFQGSQMPTFQELPPKIQEAWVNAAVAVVESIDFKVEIIV